MEIKVIKPYSDEAKEIHAGKVGGIQNLREVTINVDDDFEYHYLIRKPSRTILQAIAEYEKKGDTNKIESLLINCILEGDKEAFEHDGAIYLALLTEIGKLIVGVKTDIKKN